MFIAIILLLTLLHLNANAQLSDNETSASLAQNQSSTATLASPPGFAPVHLLVFFQPRYTVVTPALFDILKKGSGAAMNTDITANKPVPKGKQVQGGNLQYQPLPSSAGKPQNTYSTLPLMPRSNVPLPGSKVAIPAPLVNRDKKSNYDIAPLKLNRDHAPLAVSKVPVPKPLTATGSQIKNSQPKTATTTASNSGYQPLPVTQKSNVPIPRPQVVSKSQPGNHFGSIKTATTTTPGLGTINNTGTVTSLPAQQKYVSAPPGQLAKTTVVHQYDKVPASSNGYESSTKPLAGTVSSNYQTLPLKKGGYESATKPITSTSSSNYQTLPLKKGGYESATKPLSSAGTTSNPTAPLKNKGYDKINPTPAGYDNAPSPLKNYQSVTSPLSQSSTGSTAAQTTVINNYKPKVPVPSNVKPMSRPNTGVYVSAPKTNTPVGTTSTKGATEVKRGALTQGSNTKGALKVSKATQDKANADKAKEAAKQKAGKQKKAAAIRSSKKG